MNVYWIPVWGAIIAIDDHPVFSDYETGYTWAIYQAVCCLVAVMVPILLLVILF